MTDTTIRYKWDGEHMVPWPRFAKLCDQRFVVGADYELAEQEERSARSHKHFFATVHDRWLNLPDEIALQFPSDENLRKHALIMTGWHNERRLVASSPAEARKIAAFMMNGQREYALISVAGSIVVERTAKSQKTRGPDRMSPADFQKSKQDVLDWLDDLLGIERPAQERRAASPPTAPTDPVEREKEGVT